MRRHRPITGISGLLLFAAVFFPAVNGCNKPLYPLEVPVVLPPYVYGGVFALCAMAMSTRALRPPIIAIRVVTYASLALGLIEMMVSPLLGAIELAAMVIVLAAIGLRGFGERRLAASAIVVGTLCTAWFTGWATSPDALIGVYVALVGSVGIAVGGVVWVIEVPRTVKPQVPRAIALR